MKSHHTSSSSFCLSCKKQTDAATGTPGQENGGPKPDDVTVCIYCGHIMAFGEDLSLRELTDAEVVEFAGDPRLLAIQEARKRVDKAKISKVTAPAAVHVEFATEMNMVVGKFKDRLRPTEVAALVSHFLGFVHGMLEPHVSHETYMEMIASNVRVGRSQYRAKPEADIPPDWFSPDTSTKRH